MSKIRPQKQSTCHDHETQLAHDPHALTQPGLRLLFEILDFNGTYQSVQTKKTKVFKCHPSTDTPHNQFVKYCTCCKWKKTTSLYCRKKPLWLLLFFFLFGFREYLCMQQVANMFVPSTTEEETWEKYLYEPLSFFLTSKNL